MTDPHATLKGKTLLKGHTLIGEGMPFQVDGTPMPGRWWGGNGGEGAAKCRCGAGGTVVGLFGMKVWYTPGHRGCDRCGSKDRPVAAAWFGAVFSDGMWCAKCLRETGRLR